MAGFNSMAKVSVIPSATMAFHLQRIVACRNRLLERPFISHGAQGLLISGDGLIDILLGVGGRDDTVPATHGIDAGIQ